MKILGLTLCLGCSNFYLFIKSERIELAIHERYIACILSLASAGGISCLSLSGLGIPISEIFLASIFLPFIFFSAFRALNIGGILYHNKYSFTSSFSVKIGFQNLVINYLFAASKMIINKSVIIVLYDFFKNMLCGMNYVWDRLTYLPLFVLKNAGFTATQSEAIATAWVTKIFVNREVALIDLVNNGIYNDIELFERILVLTLFLNIASFPAIIIIGLNIFSFFGKNGWKYISALPFAFAIVNLISLLPLIIIFLIKYSFY
ncbi:hypothetical protein KO533_19070 [Shewanella sp. NKUCC05_KAH]|uniref:hypothetical protein n=1 Tax=Shewanella sp. NKUCC05_KAH TaxID=2842126 RepID=UPI001C5B950A|nr:hypothetical protein [Shewanella sp. NKUCC05_KAH]MBW3528653.1 hypothetical protein [Shewanella sp. NKUCC05_KAH]